MQIKNNHILFPGQRYQDSRRLLQNPKVSKNVIGFNNHAHRFTPPYYLDVDNPSVHFRNCFRYLAKYFNVKLFCPNSWAF